LNEYLDNLNETLDFLEMIRYNLLRTTYDTSLEHAIMGSNIVRAYPVGGACPVCGDQMVVTRLSCGACGSSLEGAFRLTGSSGRRSSGELVTPAGPREERFGRLARLDDAQLQFVEAFLRCRGVIKNVEDMLGISYPTVKARLASVLETMGFGPDGESSAPERRQAQREILADLAAGRITTEEAHRLLAREASDDQQGDEK
jgi:hypothetical protein